jgi:integrase
MSTFLRSTSPRRPHRFRLRLRDGSKSERFDCPPRPDGTMMSEADARAYAERMQVREDKTGALLTIRQAKRPALASAETADQWHDRFAPTRKGTVKYRSSCASVWRKWVSPLIGAVPMTGLEKQHAELVRNAIDQAVKDGRLRGSSPANTWSIFTSAIRASMQSKDKALAVRAELPDILANVLPPDNGVTAERTFLYPSEFAALVSCEKVPVEWRELYVLAAYTGLRPNELRALEWRDVDLRAGIISVVRAWDDGEGASRESTKSEAGRRIVPIFPPLHPLLERIRNRRASPRVTLMLDTTSTDVTANTLRQHMRTAGISRVRIFQRTAHDEPADFRTLRDSYATWSALQGVPVQVLQRRLGHRDIGTTNGYVKQAEAFQGAALGDPFDTLPASLISGPETGPLHTKQGKNMVARVGFEPNEKRHGLAFLRQIERSLREETGEPAEKSPALDQLLDQSGELPHVSGIVVEMGLYHALDRAEAAGEWPEDES